MNAIVKDVHREIEALRVLRDQIAALAEGDEDFIRDTLEGEADLEGLVRRLLASIGEDEAHEAGLKAYMDDLAIRRSRFADRAKTKRALIATALEIADRAKVETDVGTVSLTKVKPTAIVTEEADIPADYFKPQPPKLDKKALTDALREGTVIAGATLSNGSVSITIRRK
jgi:hypothetical protein